MTRVCSEYAASLAGSACLLLAVPGRMAWSFEHRVHSKTGWSAEIVGRALFDSKQPLVDGVVTTPRIFSGTLGLSVAQLPPWPAEGAKAKT